VLKPVEINLSWLELEDVPKLSDASDPDVSRGQGDSY
jgi:hypothetical protein